MYSPGIISLTTPLDYELTKVYNLTVRATDVLSGSYGETKLQVNVLVRLANASHMIEIDERKMYSEVELLYLEHLHFKYYQSDLEVQTTLT